MRSRSAAFSALSSVGHARRGRVSFEAVVAGENPQRPAVGPDLVDVEYAQSLCGEDLLDGQ